MTEIIKEKLKTIKGFGTITKLEVSSLITTIESQKEEIEKIKRALSNAGEFVARGLIEESELKDEIESLKAITELAVKGLQTELYWATRLNHTETVKRLAPLISEIERLTHE